MASDARARFVEAMREIRKAAIGACVPLKLEVRAAVEAFADAECGGVYREYPDYAHGGTTESGASWSKPHSRCRTALLKEVFGE